MQVIRESTTRILQACRFPVQRPASIAASPAPSSHEIAQTAQACRLNAAMQPPPEELDVSEKVYIAEETKKNRQRYHTAEAACKFAVAKVIASSPLFSCQDSASSDIIVTGFAVGPA